LAVGGFSRNQFFKDPQPVRFPTLDELTKAVPDHPLFMMEGFSGPGATNALGKAFLEKNGVPVGADGFVDGGAFGVATPCTTALFLLRQMQTRDSMLQGLRDAVRTLSLQGELTNRIWINFLHVEEDVSKPELRARLLNSWNDFGGDMLHV